MGLERSLAVRRSDLPLLVLAAALGIWLNQVSFVYALTFTTASTAALVMGTLPIFTALIAWSVRLQRLSARTLVAGAISFGSVALVAAGSASGLSGDLRGIVLTLATAVTWAGYSVLITPLMERYSPFRISSFVLLVGHDKRGEVQACELQCGPRVSLPVVGRVASGHSGACARGGETGTVRVIVAGDTTYVSDG